MTVFFENPKIGWHTIIGSDGSGYGHVSHQMHEAFLRMGANMASHTSFDWDLVVCCTPPRSVIIGKGGKRPDVVFHTMFECDTIPPEWPEVLNRAGLLWVPSDYCVDLFRNHGVTTPIFKVGYAVEQEVYQYVDREEKEEPFKVLIWADSLMSRKNALTAIKAFVLANLPNAELEIKISDGIAPKGNWMIDGRVLDNITIHSDYWPRMEIVRWLQSGDVGIYLSGGEGYGLMPKEGMATGLPMIIAANTGMLEYANSTNSLLVECNELERSDSMSNIFGMELQTYKPNLEQTIDHLRWAYANRKELYALGKKGAADATRQTWDDVVAEAYYHLNRYYEEHIKG